MINAELNLNIFRLNKISLEYEIVSLDKYNLIIPYSCLNENSDIIDSLNMLFESVVDLSSSYIKHKLYDAFIDNQKLTLRYFCMIPFGTNLKTGSFLPIKEYENYKNNFSKIIQYF